MGVVWVVVSKLLFEVRVLVGMRVWMCVLGFHQQRDILVVRVQGLELHGLRRNRHGRNCFYCRSCCSRLLLLSAPPLFLLGVS